MNPEDSSFHTPFSFPKRGVGGEFTEEHYLAHQSSLKLRPGKRIFTDKKNENLETKIKVSRFKKYVNNFKKCSPFYS